MNTNTTTQMSSNNLEEGSKSLFDESGISETSEKEDFGISSLEIKGVSMKLCTDTQPLLREN